MAGRLPNLSPQVVPDPVSCHGRGVGHFQSDPETETAGAAVDDVRRTDDHVWPRFGASIWNGLGAMEGASKKRKLSSGKSPASVMLEPPALTAAVASSPSTEPSPREASSSTNNATVFIGGLHPSMTSAHVEKLMTPYGDIDQVRLIPNKGYAFCRYAEPASAVSAMAKLDGRLLLGKRLRVQPGRERQPEAKKRTIEQERSSVDARIKAIRRKLEQGANAGSSG